MSAPSPEQPLFENLIASRPRRERRSALAAVATSTVVHGALLGALVWATMAAGGVVETEEEVTMLIPVVEDEPPPPPPPPPPEVRVQQTAAVEVPRGFQVLSVPTVVLPDIPPPDLGAPVISERDFTGIGAEGGRADGTLKSVDADNIEAAPTFTPFTVSPELRNREEVARALERSYPPLLRDAGIGGKAVVWFFIDEEGRVVRTQIHASSGYDALDQAALEVAEIMRFSPALNRDQRVRVWVQIPIQFTTK